MNAFEDCYKSPIDMIVSQMSSEFDRMAENQLMLKVNQAVDFNVDKAELLKALQYDRNQYETGYLAAKKKYQRPKGKWIPRNDKCPCCGENKFKDLDADIYADWYPKFCPNCGAEMEVSE